MRKNNQKILIATVVLALAALACASSPSGPQAGAEAPDFELPTPQGNELALSTFRGRPVMLNFFTTWCGPCQAEMPAMQAVYQRYAGEGLVLLAVDLQDTPDEVADYGEEMGLSFPLLVDEQGRVGNLYGVNSFPRTFFIDTDGVIRHIAVGTMAEEEIEDDVKDLLKRAQEAQKQPIAQAGGENAGSPQGCVSVRSALARTGSGKQYPGVMRLEHAACFTFDARSADGDWLRLAAERSPSGERLWVTAEFIDLEQGAGELPTAE